MAHLTSCGVVVTDRDRLLLGHATCSPRWDIPKGIAELGESFMAAALRELDEETGLHAPAEALRDLGVHRYMPGKDLALFAWIVRDMPQPERLVCRSTFVLPNGIVLPEFERFALFDWESALAKVGKNLARLLAQVRSRLAAAP